MAKNKEILKYDLTNTKGVMIIFKNKQYKLLTKNLFFSKFIFKK